MENADYLQMKNGDEYYIALASDTSWVIEQDTNNAARAKIQQKTGADAQKVKVYRQPDGSYSFQSNVNGKWLDLDGGKTENFTVVHFWENGATPTNNDNQKWYLLGNGDGTYRIKPKPAVKNGSNAVLDLNTGKPSAGQVIQAYENNGSAAQQWRLIPVSRETTQILEVDANNGKLHIDDLTPGTYTLRETQAPGNYLGLTDTVTITVDQSGNITVVSAPRDPNGDSMAKVDGTNLGLLTVLNNPNTVDLTLEKKVVGSNTRDKFPFTITYTPHGEATTTVTVDLASGDSHRIENIAYGTEVTITETAHDGFSVLFKKGEAPLEANGDSCTFTITSNVTITAENHTGYQLPSTGGMGTGWFTLAGLLLMTGAAALTILRRRAKEGGPE